MARTYHLNLFGADWAVMDEDGLTCQSIEQAASSAVAGIRDLVANDARSGRIDLRGRIEIADDLGVVLRTVAFSDAVRIRGGRIVPFEEAAMASEVFDTASRVAAAGGTVEVEGPDSISLTLTAHAAAVTGTRLIEASAQAEGQRIVAAEERRLRETRHRND